MPPESAQIPLKNSSRAEYGADVETQATQLMTATKQGDAAAFDELISSLRGRAYSVARSLVGSNEDAMDLCQEAFLKTYRARETYREGDPFLPWFHRILRNTCFSFLRKKGRLKRHSLSAGREEDEGDWEIVDDAAPVSSAIERDEAANAFWEGFRQLSARDREVLTLRHFQELSYREISVALDVPEGTVMSRLFHARRRLRERLLPQLENALSEYAAPEPGSEPTRRGDQR